MIRSFSTAARVHPNILAHLHRTPRRALTRPWLKTAIAVSLIGGYASKTYIDHARAQHQARAIAEERDWAERQKMLMELYGDRESLEDLERAVAEYGKK